MGLKKTFGGKAALEGITFSVPEANLVTILGPSGSGKTTLLRCIAGVETPDEGTISINDRVVFDGSRASVPPEKRGIGMVFQSNALWPHLTVRKNVAYPLEIRNDRDTMAKVDDVLALLKIGSLGDRYPNEISGGEQQRVAIARAIVYKPSVVLLDEPFSNLDTPLRESLRDELRQLQVRLKMTMLYVTHERVDALSIGDSMAVLSDGRMMAFGSPSQLVTAPPNSYTAQFVGGMLALPGVSARQGHGIRVKTQYGEFMVSDGPEGKVAFCIPPTSMKIAEDGKGSLEGTVTGTVMRPSGVYGVRVSTGAGVVELTLHGGPLRLAPGQGVMLDFDPAACLVLPR